jgi:hypothetical protein
MATGLTKREDHVVVRGSAEETITTGLLQCTHVNVLLSERSIEFAQPLIVKKRSTVQCLYACTRSIFVRTLEYTSQHPEQEQYECERTSLH